MNDTILIKVSVPCLKEFIVTEFIPFTNPLLFRLFHFQKEKECTLFVSVKSDHTVEVLMVFGPTEKELKGDRGFTTKVDTRFYRRTRGRLYKYKVHRSSSVVPSFRTGKDEILT